MSLHQAKTYITPHSFFFGMQFVILQNIFTLKDLHADIRGLQTKDPTIPVTAKKH